MSRYYTHSNPLPADVARKLAIKQQAIRECREFDARCPVGSEVEFVSYDGATKQARTKGPAVPSRFMVPEVAIEGERYYIALTRIIRILE